MMKNKNLIGFLYIVAIMALTMLIFISNLIVGNIFGIIVGIFAVIVLCFGLGYMYSQYELSKGEKQIVEEKTEEAPKEAPKEEILVKTDKDLTQL